MRRGAIVVLVSVAGIASCTIYALSDDIHQAQCEFVVAPKRSFDTCDALNNRSDPESDRCNNWRCGADHYCEIGRLDRDRDGFSPSACVPAGEPGDCADVDPSSRPGAEELCDGSDNDCDGSVDEGLLRVDERIAMTFDDEVSALAFAWHDVTRDVGVVYRNASDDAVGFGIIASVRSVMGQPVWLSDSDEVFRASAVNVAPSSGNFVLSTTEAAPTHRSYVGNVVSGMTRAILTLDDINQRRTGLRCASDEACATAQGPRSPIGPEAQQPPGPAPTIPVSTRPELAVLETQLLAGYARTLDPAADGCDVTSPDPPLLFNVLDNGVGGFAELSSDAIRLDTASELRSPSIVAIDAGLVTASRGPFGWLVSYLDPRGTLVFRRVPPPTGEVFADVELRLTPDPEPYLETRMLRGPVEDNRFLIGVAARAGCGDRARVVFGLLLLSWDAEGRNQLRVYRELREVGDPGQRASRPVLAYNRVESSWAVAYATPDGLFARVLDGNGQPVGTAAYRLTDTLPPVPDMTIVSGAPDAVGLFTVYTYEERADQSPSHALIGRELRTCLDSAR